MSGFSVYPFERKVQPKFLFFNAKLSLRDNRLIVFVNFSFSSGCDLHNRSQNTKKKPSDCILIWHITLSWLMMDFSIQKWNILLCLTETPGFSVHPFWAGWICITRSIRSSVLLKLRSLNSKLSVHENWTILLMNVSFSCGCDLHDRRQK